MSDIRLPESSFSTGESRVTPETFRTERAVPMGLHFRRTLTPVHTNREVYLPFYESKPGHVNIRWTASYGS